MIKKNSTNSTSFERQKFATNIRTKANIFNKFFAEQCAPLKNGSVLPSSREFLTQERLISFDFSNDEILKLIRPLNVHKAQGHDDVSISRSSHQRCYIKEGVLRNYIKFTGKHLCQSLFLNKVAGLRPATLLKKRLWHRCFSVKFVKFLRSPFYRTPLDDCFFIRMTKICDKSFVKPLFYFKMLLNRLIIQISGKCLILYLQIRKTISN